MVPERGDHVFDIFFEASPAAMLLAEAGSGRVVDANPSACRLFGMERDGLSGLPLGTLIADGEDDAPGPGAGSRWAGQRRLLAAGGRERWGLVTVTPLGPERGGRDASVGHDVVHFEDVTAIREVQRAVAGERALFRSAFMDAPIGMAVSGPEPSLLQANPALAEMLGRDPGDLRALRPEDILPPTAEHPDGALMRALLASDRGRIQVEREYVRTDGTQIIARVTSSAVRDEAGNLARIISQVEDITAQRAAEQDLAAAREEYRFAFESAAIGMTVNDPDGTIVEANPAFAAMTGYCVDELRGMSFRDTATPEFIEANAAIVAKVVDGTHDRVQFEKPFVRKDGTTFWGRVNGAAARDGRGRLLRLVSQIEDITAERAARDALAEREATLRLWFDSSAIGKAISDASGTFVDANPAFCDMLGFQRDELLGRRFDEVSWPEDLPAELPLYEQALAGARDHYRLEKRYRRRDGSPVWTRTTVSCQRGADGAVTRFIGEVEDIEAERSAREALAESEAQLRATFDEAAIGMLLCDERGAILRVNPAFAAMFGYSQEEIAGRTFLDITHPEDRALSSPVFGPLVAGEIDRFRLRRRYLRKDGSVVWARVNVRAVCGPAGEFRHTIGQIEDITDIHEAQEALAAGEARWRSTFE
ncbi:MAG: PAS domain S-box protein, partial [Chloroflexota bacterium]